MVTDVGILELEGHPNHLYYFSRIANSPDHRVTIFAHETVFEAAEPMFDGIDDVDVRPKPDDESTETYLDAVEAECDDGIDFLHVNSIYGEIDRLRTYARFDPECKSLLWLHNLDIWTNPAVDVEGKTDRHRRIDLQLRTAILENHSGALIEYAPLMDHLESAGPLPADPKLFMPTFHSDEGLPEQSGVTFVVPGRITATRKRFREVIDAFEAVNERHPGSQLCLLGQVGDDSGREIVEYVDESSARDDVEYFDDWIPHQLFDRRLSASTAIVAPVRETYVNRFVRERYGKTKATGNVHDAVRFGRPLLVPDHHPTSDRLSGLVHTYDGVDGLEATMSKMCEDDEFRRELLRSAKSVGERFELADQRRRYAELIDSLPAN